MLQLTIRFLKGIKKGLSKDQIRKEIIEVRGEYGWSEDQMNHVVGVIYEGGTPWEMATKIMMNQCAGMTDIQMLRHVTSHPDCKWELVERSKPEINPSWAEVRMLNGKMFVDEVNGVIYYDVLSFSHIDDVPGIVMPFSRSAMDCIMAKLIRSIPNYPGEVDASMNSYEQFFTVCVDPYMV